MWNGLSSGDRKLLSGAGLGVGSPSMLNGGSVSGVKAQRPQGVSPRTNGLDADEMACHHAEGAGAVGVKGDASKRRVPEDRHSDVRGSSPASRSFAGWCPLLGSGQRRALTP